MNSDRATATLALETGLSAQVPHLNKRPHVTVRGLSKRFNDAVIYDRFDLDIPRGKLVAIFGPNGCGKSTLINMIAGLVPVDAGEILFDGQTINEITFGYVFQNYREALFPWLRAIENIEYPLKLKNLPRRELPWPLKLAIQNGPRIPAHWAASSCVSRNS